jgi:hydroxyethylthiazole kinase-like uncharacterized protein yjeF
MHELLTAAEMGEADRRTIAAGTPGIVLMENAGRAVAEAAARLVPEGPVLVLVLAGPGNNGGDGFVAARLLAEQGHAVRVMLLGPEARLRGDAAEARARWTGPVEPAGLPLPPAALVVDALFGAGLARPLDGLAAALVAAMNEGPAPVLAVDVPSGLPADDGAPTGPCVAATATVTFFRRKPGHLLYPGRALCGPVTLAQIGIPEAALEGIAPKTWENAPALWRAALPAPGVDGHKYRRGHALVVSGPMTRTGAARLAAGAALRLAGLATLASPPGALAVNAAHLTAVMLKRCAGATGLAEILEDARFSSVALGPALGLGAESRDLVLAALASGAAVTLDADGLTAFAETPETLFAATADRAAPVVITPHDGEFARLFPDLAALPRPVRARAAAARAGAVVVLKGPDTAIAAPDGRLAVNANAPPWLAAAGSGDVLTGIVAGILARAEAPGFEAACAAVWLHGAAGAEAGPGLTAEDLSPALRPVLARLWGA